MCHILMNPVYDQLYYVSFRAHNNAGLIAELCSDGQRLVEKPSASLISEMLSNITLFPNKATDHVNIQGINMEISLQIFDLSGMRILDTILTEDSFLDHTDLASGNYHIVLRAEDQFLMTKLHIVR